MESKVCTKCKIEKDLCEFRKDKTKTDGHYSSCKSCKLEYRRVNKVLVNLSAKRLRDYHKSENPEEYYIKNRERGKKYYETSKTRKKLMSYKIENRLKNSLRSRVRNFLKSVNIIKTNKTILMVGCSPESLKKHLEKQFKEGMCWDNYGYHGWHIDHIIPLSSAKTEEEIYKLIHYTNLQPLWARDNLIKSNKLPK
jgi:hypothetical protein